MSNEYLTREDAPIGPEAWKALDDTMIQAARSVLTGRRLLHIEGPYGLGLKSVPMQDNIIGDGMVTYKIEAILGRPISGELGPQAL